MKVEKTDIGNVVVTRTEDSARIYKESKLMHHIANILKENGEDVIRKEMSKDGHMVNDGVYYIVDRKRRYCYLDYDYEVRDICKDYNDGDYIVLYRKNLGSSYMKTM